jgi:NADP-dependent 3-hydroxy acid dehydrogenase YdfG
LPKRFAKNWHRREVKVCNIEPAKTGADFQYPNFTAAEQAEENRKETMLRAEDIAVGVHYVLTQPRRAVVQQVVIALRARGEE